MRRMTHSLSLIFSLSLHISHTQVFTIDEEKQSCQRDAVQPNAAAGPLSRACVSRKLASLLGATIALVVFTLFGRSLCSDRPPA